MSHPNAAGAAWQRIAALEDLFSILRYVGFTGACTALLAVHVWLVLIDHYWSALGVFLIPLGVWLATRGFGFRQLGPTAAGFVLGLAGAVVPFYLM